MAWIDGPLIGLDLETDSPDPDDAHLITAAVLHHMPGRPLSLVRFEWVAQPTRPIPDAAAKIHEYTTERAMAEGLPIAQVIDEISQVLADRWSQGCPMITCNSPFDLTIIDREMGRHLGTALDLDALPPVVDTLLIDRMCDRYRAGSRRLADTCKHYGVVLDGAHDATADVHATMRLAWKLARRPADSWPAGRYGPKPEQIDAWNTLASGDLGRLYRAQREWYRSDSLQLAEYFRSPKSVAKIERDHESGVTTRAEADELIRTLPARADNVERHADGWPMRKR